VYSYYITLKKNIGPEYFECEKQEAEEASVNIDMKKAVDIADSFLLISREGVPTAVTTA
jgi:hypothetical protein